MTILVSIIAVCVVAALVAFMMKCSTKFGTMFVLMGCLLWAHAGVTAVVIARNGGVDPGYRWMGYYLMFATIPAGLIFVLLGITAACVQRCLRRCRDNAVSSAPASGTSGQS